MHIPIEIRNQQGRGSGVRGNRGSRVYPLIKANTPSPSITPGSLLRFAVRRDDNVSNRASGSGDMRAVHTQSWSLSVGAAAAAFLGEGQRGGKATDAAAADRK